MEFNYGEHREFLEDLLNKCLGLADTIDLFYNAALTQEEEGGEVSKDLPGPTEEQYQMMLERFEANYDYCLELLEWFKNLIEVFSKYKTSDTYEYEDDPTMLTAEEAMRQHKIMYPDDWKDKL